MFLGGGRPVVAKYLFRWPVLSPGIASRVHQARERGDQDLLEEGRESLLTTFWFEWLRGCREFAFPAARARNDSASGWVQQVRPAFCVPMPKRSKKIWHVSCPESAYGHNSAYPMSTPCGVPPINHRGMGRLSKLFPRQSLARRRSDRSERSPHDAPTPDSDYQSYQRFYDTGMPAFVKRIYLPFKGLGRLAIRLPLYNTRVMQQLKHRKEELRQLKNHIGQLLALWQKLDGELTPFRKT